MTKLYNPPLPDVTYAGYTMEQIVEALADVLDGVSVYDLEGNTGIPIERCEKIIDIHRAMMTNRNPYA